MNSFQDIVVDWLNCFPFVETPFKYYSDLEGVAIIEELLSYANDQFKDAGGQLFSGIDDFIATQKCRFLAMVTSDECITKEVITKAMETAAGDDVSFSPGTPQYKSSPLSMTESPLQNFYQSPLTQKYKSPYVTGNKSRRDMSGQQLKFVKEDLEDMTAENEKLQEQVKQLKEDKAKLSKKLQFAQNKIDELKDEIEISKKSVKTCAGSCIEKIHQALREKQDIKDYNEKLLGDISALEKENSELLQKMDMLEINALKEMEALTDIFQGKITSCHDELQERESKIRELETLCEELREIAKSRTHESPHFMYRDDMFSSPDESLCRRNRSTSEKCNVVYTDVLLQEKEIELKDKDSELQKLKNTIEALEKELDFKDSQLALMNTENQSLQTSTLELQDKIDVLEELSNGLSNNFNCLKDEKEQLFSENQLLDQQLKETVLKLNDLSTQYAKLQITFEDLTVQNDSAATELLILQDQYSESLQENVQHLLRMEQLASAEKTYLKQISTYESELKIKEEESEKYLTQLRALESKYMILDKACSVSEEKRINLEKDFSKLQDNFDSLSIEHSEVKSKLQYSEKQKEDMMSELSCVAANFNSEIQHLRSEKESLQKDYDKLKQDLQKEILNRNEVLEMYNKCSTFLVEKEEEIKILRSEADKLQSNIKDLEESERIFKTQLIDEKNINKSLDEQNQQLNEKLSNIVNTTEELTEMLQNANCELESHKNEVAEKSETINNLVEQIENLKLSHKDKVEKQEKIIQEKAQEISDYILEIQQKECTIASIETSLAERNAKLKTSLDNINKLEALVSELDVKLSESERENMEERILKKENAKQMQELKTENSKLNTQVEELTFELDCQKELLTSMSEKNSSEIEKLTSAISVFEERCLYLKEQVSELQNTSKNKQLELESKIAEIVTLTESVTTLKETMKERSIEFENTMSAVVSDHKLKIEDLTNELSVALDQKNKFGVELENEREQICNERKKFNECCVNLAKKEQEIEEIHVQLNMYSSQIHNFRSDMQELHNQLEYEMRKNEALTAEVENKEKIIQAATKENEELLSDLTEMKKSSYDNTEKLREEIIQRENNIEKLAQELKDTKSHFETKIKQNNNEKIEAHCQLFTYEKTVLSLKNKIDDYISQIENLKIDNNTLSNHNDDLNSKLAVIQKEYDCSAEQFNSTVEELQLQNITLQKEKENLIFELKNEKQNSDVQHSNLSSQIEQLSATLLKYECDVLALRTKISELEIKHKLACSELEEEASEITILSETILEKTSQVENLIFERNRYLSDIKKLTEDLKCVNEHVIEIQTKYDNCSSELYKVQQVLDNHAAVTNAHVSTISDLEANRRELDTKLINEKMKYDYLSMQYGELENALNVEITSKDQTIYNLNNELHLYAIKVNTLEDAKKKVEKEAQDEKSRYKCLLEECNELKEVLSMDIENKEGQVSDLMKQLSELLTKLKNLEDDKVKLEFELQNEKYKTGCLMEKEEELEKAKLELNDMEQTVNNLNNLLNTHLKNMAVLEESKKELESHLEKEKYHNQLLSKEHEVIKDTLLEDIHSKAQTIDDLSFQLESYRSNINELTKVKEDMETNLNAERQKYSCLLKEFSDMKELLNSEICDKTQTIKDLHLTMTAYSTDITSMGKSNEELECQLQNVNRANENFSEEVEQLKNDTVKLMKDKTDLEQQLLAVTEEKYSLLDQEKILKSDIVEKSRKLNVLTDELDELKLKMATEIEQYEIRLEESNNKLSLKALQIEEHKNHISCLEAQVSDFTIKLEKANSEVSLLRDTNLDLSTEVSKITELHAEKETMQNEIEDLERQLLYHQETFIIKEKEHNTEMENVKSTLANTEKECNDLKIKISTLETINRNTAMELGEKISEIKKLSSSALSLETNLRQCQLQYEKDAAEMKACYESDIGKLREENDKLTSEIEKFGFECDLKNKNISELSGQIYLLEEKLQCEKSRNDSLEKENGNLNNLYSSIQKSKEDLVTKIKSFISVEKSLSAKLENVNGYDNLQKAMKKFMSEYTRVSDNCRKVLLNENLKKFDMNIIISLHNEVSTLSITTELEHTNLLCEYISLVKENISWCERNTLKLLYSSGVENINLDSYMQEHKSRIASQISKVECQIVNLTTRCAEGLSKCKVLISHCIPIIMDSLSSNETPMSREFSELEEDGWNTEDILERNILPKNISSNLEMLEKLQTENISLKFKVNDLEKSKSDLKKKVEQMKSFIDGKAEQTELLAVQARSSEAFLQKLKEENSVKIQDLQKQLEQIKAEKQKQENDKHQDMENLKTELHAHYNKKLDRYKQQVLQAVAQKVEAQIREKEAKLKGTEAKLKEKDRQISEFEREMKRLQRALQQMSRQREQYYKEVIRLKGENRASFMTRDSFFQTPMKSSRSEETLCLRERPRETLDTIDERLSNRRSSIFAPREEDEEGDEFNSKFLDDLTAGRCEVEHGKQRLTELKYRNSLCPPHLKSSYPAETQFHNLVEFTEDDLKLGSTVDVDPTTSLLQQSDRHRRKEKSTYSKPGPPTPGKHGGRASLQGLENTPRHALAEKNDQTKKPSTPGQYIRHLFSRSGRQDENCPITPAKSHRRSIFKRQKN